MTDFFDKKAIRLLVPFILVLLPLIHTLRALVNFCMPMIDYSIYQQAIYEIAEGISLNPYLTTRDIFVFNEHFDPIIFLAVPFTWLTNYSYLGLGTFEWFWYLAFAGFCLTKSNFKDRSEWLLGICFIFFSRSILSGLFFSGHPVTWAIFPLATMTYYLFKDRFSGVFLSALALCFFKETFAFGIAGLATSYLLSKDWKKFLLMATLGLFFLAFEFKLRELWIGKTLGYGNQFLGKLVSSPFEYTIQVLADFNYKAFFKVFFPFFIPIFLILKKIPRDRSFFSHPAVKVIFFMLPLIGIHIIINRFSYHHASKFSALMIPLVLFSGVLSEIKKSRKLMFFTLLLCLIHGMSMYTKVFRALFANKVGRCHINKAKDPYASAIKKTVQRLTMSSKIFTTGGIGPYLMKPRLNIYNHLYGKRPDHLQYIVLEMLPTDSLHPLHPHEVVTMRNECKKFATDIFLDNQYYFFAKGSFPKSCLWKRPKQK